MEFEDIFQILIICIIALFVVMIGIAISTSNDACDKFGGKLSGQLNCIKDGVSYDLENKGLLTFEKEVVRRAVETKNDASLGADE